MTDRPERPRRGRGALVGVVAATVAGALWWASQPPLASAPAVLLVVTAWLAAVLAVADRGVGRVALVGSLVGWVAFVPMLYWLALPAGWLAVALLAGVQAAWLAAASVVVRRWVRSPWVVAVAPVVWTAMEVLRARVPLGGFGWGDLASGHVDGSFLLGTARVLGADGLTLLTALFGALVFDVGRRLVAVRAGVGPTGAARDARVRPTRLAARADAGATAIDAVRPALLGLVGVAAAGLLVTIGPPGAVGELDVLLVQGNDGTNAASGAEEDLRIATLLADETLAAVGDGPPPDVVVWPEYALDRDPFRPEGADLAEQVARVATAVDSTLVAGVRTTGTGAGTFANELVALDADGLPAATYRKQQLVPFGEYVPWRSVFGGYPPLARMVPRDAVAGEGPAVLRAAGVDLAVAICFETLFGPIVRDAVRASDAGVVLAATNDASYGRSPASRQHVAQSRLRAVETGRWVVHASLSGESAVIDPDGVVVAAAGLFEVSSVRARVPVVAGGTPALVVAPVLAWSVLVAGAVVVALGVAPRVAARQGAPA